MSVSGGCGHPADVDIRRMWTSGGCGHRADVCARYLGGMSAMPLLLQSPSFELWWEPPLGTFRLESPGRILEGVVGVEMLRGRRAFTLTTDMLTLARVEQTVISDVHGTAEEAVIYYQEVRGLVVSVRIRLYASRPFVLFRVSVTNVSPESLNIRYFFFRTTAGGFQSLELPTGFFSNGWQSWSHSGFLPAAGEGISLPLLLRFFQGPMIHNVRTPWPRKAGRFWSESVGVVVTPREALVLGGASLADQFVQVYADLRGSWRPRDHQDVMLQSQCDDVPLPSGEVRSSEWFYLEWVASPHTDPLAQYAHAVARQMQVTSLKPAPSGWCSWYIFGSQVSEADVMKNLATGALVADEFPLGVIQLDEGYQSIWGDWTTRNVRFPHDLKWLADRIKGSGFTPGLWLGPLTAHPKSRLVTEHPEWLLRSSGGRPVSPGLISGVIMRALDPTHPGVENYLRELIALVVQRWGYRYLKLDFMYAGALPGKRYNPRLTRAQAMRQAFSVIREAAGEATYLLGCGAPLGPAIGLVDAMRIGPDTAPAWNPNYNVGCLSSL
ncbi:MAG: alpha-galactosidase, partial [Anaerolineae bacterium]|nr:alpha-galactosidase [Anaerolineae bacterium]